MSLLFASALAANIVAAADIDLASPVIFISEDARAAVAAGTVQKLICLDLPERSRKFRSACLTSGEWQETVQRSKRAESRSKARWNRDGLLPHPLPSQIHPSHQSWGLR